MKQFNWVKQILFTFLIKSGLDYSKDMYSLTMDYFTKPIPIKQGFHGIIESEFKRRAVTNLFTRVL